VFAPTFNANMRSGAVDFGVPIRLAPRALDNMIFLPWRFDNHLHIAYELKVIYAFVVVLRFRSTK
jgi:hypothetical protein